VIGVGVLASAFFVPKIEPKDAIWIVVPTLLSVAMLIGATIQIMVWSKNISD
jgi:hypothetical protein